MKYLYTYICIYNYIHFNSLSNIKYLKWVNIEYEDSVITGNF